MGFEVVVEVHVSRPAKSCRTVSYSITMKVAGRLDRNVHAAVLAELVPTPTAGDVPLTLQSTAGGWYIDDLVCCSYPLLVQVSAVACVAIEALLLPGVQAFAWAALLVLVLLVACSGQVACG